MNHGTSSFDIRSYFIQTQTPLAKVFPTVYHPQTHWVFDDNVFDSLATEVPVNDPAIGIAALDNGAFVEAIGVFNTTVTPMTFRADKIYITFPDVKEGVVDNGWTLDNTFVLRLSQDNVVFPKPDRATAYYDNETSHSPLAQNAIDNNVNVMARGYFTTGGIEAYWISVGP